MTRVDDVHNQQATAYQDNTEKTHTLSGKFPGLFSRQGGDCCSANAQRCIHGPMFAVCAPLGLEKIGSKIVPGGLWCLILPVRAVLIGDIFFQILPMSEFCTSSYGGVLLSLIHI